MPSGTTEFVIVGLLPTVAGDLGISLPLAVLIVTVCAMGHRRVSDLVFGEVPALGALSFSNAPGCRSMWSSLHSALQNTAINHARIGL